MPEKIYILPKNSTFCKIDSYSEGIIQELSDRFTFTVPNAKYQPAVRMGRWDGKIRLLNRVNDTLYVGLIKKLYEYAKENGIEVENQRLSKSIKKDVVEKFLASFSANGKELREWQKNAILSFANNTRRVIVSPTGSGKSLVIYALALLLKEHVSPKPVLIVTPATNLLYQLQTDFEEYSKNTYNFTKKDIQLIGDKSPKIVNTTSTIVISTWQSIYKMDSEYFNQFSGIIWDEAHKCKANCLKAILENCTELDWRIGLTGTLDGTEVNEMMLEALFGPVFIATTAKKEIAAGNMCKLAIDVIKIKYSLDTVRKLLPNKKITTQEQYQKEIDFIVSHSRRNNFITNLALNIKGNTLVLFRLKDKHGVALFDSLLKKSQKYGKKIFYIAGEVEAEEREKIRTLLNKEDNCIIVATYGTCSTGVNFINLHNIILAAPSKSKIQVLQSIGRGTRLNEGKIECKIYDLVDDLRIKSYVNYCYKHGTERIKFYMSEEHPIEESVVNIEPT